MSTEEKANLIVLILSFLGLGIAVIHNYIENKKP